MKAKDLLKRFAPYYKPHLKIFIIDLFCALGVALAGLVFPMLVRYLLNVCLAGGEIVWGSILFVAGAMLGVRVIELLCSYYMTTVGHVMGSRVEAAMRRDLYVKLLSLSASFYDERQVGDLMSRVNNDLFEITEFSHHCPEEIFLAGIRLIGVFIYLSMLNLWLTLILFALIPPLVIFAIINNRRMRKVFRERRRKVSQINSQLEDSLAGISVVRSFGGEDVEIKKFDRNNEDFVRIKTDSYKIMGVFHSGTQFSSGLMYVATVIFGVIFIQLGTLTTVDLVAFLLYVSTLLSTVTTIMNYTEQFQNGMSAFDRFIEIMDEPVQITSPENAKDIERLEGEIEFKDVVFAYDETKDVLKKLSFKVNKGESLAIVGPSGAGKTTIANIIPRFYDIKEGTVTIDGVNVQEYDLKTLRSNVGIVQQNVYLFYGSVKENILFARPDATDEEVMDAAKKAGAHEFITKLEKGYDTVCGERGVKLSGGQKQRIAIARLFLKNPPLLILDEATSALDNESERLVQSSLDELAKNRTTITIAHRLTTIKKADRIIVLTEEGIIEEGNHATLLQKGGTYASLYSLYGGD
ncbi:MAG: ABC transporter ATP-binding protein [Clostridia bacterium]|nr:ABC transporter ATP-binding protein [Clostridia bacterium]